jgi:hypothetical protein
VFRCRTNADRSTSWNTRWAGKVAGADNGRGYIVIRFDGCKYYAHRLAWFYMTGEWPSSDLDHDNRMKNQTKIDNLRPATRSQNEFNKGITKRNTSGYKGVSYVARSRKWGAYIALNGKSTYLGMYTTPEEASERYRCVRDEYLGSFKVTD